jgi:hypothetical protein
MPVAVSISTTSGATRLADADRNIVVGRRVGDSSGERRRSSTSRSQTTAFACS